MSLRRRAYLIEARASKITLETFTPAGFFGAWFTSAKPKDKRIYEMLAKKYPYTGRAFRMDDGKRPSFAPFTSWSRTVNGIQEWMRHMGAIRTPDDMEVYAGKIVRGVDLAKFVRANGLHKDRAGQMVMDVEEVFPLKTVKAEKVYRG